MVRVYYFDNSNVIEFVTLLQEYETHIMSKAMKHCMVLCPIIYSWTYQIICRGTNFKTKYQQTSSRYTTISYTQGLYRVIAKLSNQLDIDMYNMPYESPQR